MKGSTQHSPVVIFYEHGICTGIWRRESSIITIRVQWRLRHRLANNAFGKRTPHQLSREWLLRCVHKHHILSSVLSVFSASSDVCVGGFSLGQSVSHCDVKHFFTSEAYLSFSVWVACKAVRVNAMSVEVNTAEANYCRFRSSASQTTLSSPPQTCRQWQHGIKHMRSSLPVNAPLQIRPRSCSWTTHITVLQYTYSDHPGLCWETCCCCPLLMDLVREPASLSLTEHYILWRW